MVELHTRKSLDNLIATRATQLTAYQNAAYAARYTALVERVRAAERALGGETAQQPLTEAVARNLYKLMAYKDEYEVARLQSDPAFLEKLKSQFEGDWSLRFHLAPPILGKHDAQGKPVKQTFGPWMLPAFRMLAKLRGLRGTAFDPFGYMEERRTERALIGEYETLVGELIGARLTQETLPLAVELAQLPDGIRGYGHVKANNLSAVRAKWERLLARWRAPQDGRSQQAA